MSNIGFPALVAEVLDEFRVVINRGSDHNIELGNRFMIYELTQEIMDPETNESLGRLQVTKGTGKAILVQEKMAIIKSDMTKEKPSTSINPMLDILKPRETIPVPFENAKRGDKVKPI